MRWDCMAEAGSLLDWGHAVHVLGGLLQAQETLGYNVVAGGCIAPC